ncbi:vitellogenin-like [Eriocheir sinensis]|uniref:vitellogenin-like n=1 Tax=Eriocheir sinensis TaxID=95602 RepID=UPI0021CA8827|nr:vitellogenin-like [Eriocheir sinensis]
MTNRTALMLLALAAAAAAPYGDAVPRCSTECPVAAAKFSFIPGKTYSYTYTGKSKVQLKGVEGGLVETRWEKTVLMTWLSPCDVALSFKDTKVDGEAGPPGASMLEKYPLVVAMTDGRVQRVCSHPDDDTWAINMKKGVASALQISLPSLSTSNSGLNLTETDVVGTCPTRYEVETDGSKVVVKKEKNHRLCQERYATPDETHLPWLKGPLPMQESWSVCTHEINSGIISSVKCEDKKVVRPAYGTYKFVEAEQESTLRLTSSDVPTPDIVSRISQGHLVPKRLLYDYETPKKEPSLVPQLEQTLRHLCDITKDEIPADAAVELDKAVHFMRRIPLQGFKEIYAKVRSKQICPQHNKLKSLYFDAIAFVHEPESVIIMAKELAEGRATGARAAIYSAAFYLVPRPNMEAVQALEPLFRADEPYLSSAKLAAASMVNRYCRHNPQCYNEAPVKSLPQAMKQMIQNDLSASNNEEAEKKALAAFKSLGNMGVMTHDVAEVLIRYMHSEQKKVNNRVAAVQAFRLSKCNREVTQKLVDFAVRPGKNTEVRIAAYLTALRCVDYEDLQTIVTKISVEENTQVRGFILSHLLNLQETNAPEKERLRSLLTNILIPDNFERDLRKYSRNIDLSYFAPSLGLGAEVESNLIYAPGSFFPRSLDVNLTAAVDGTGTPINIGEIGGRLEGLEPIIAQLFGPAGYFKKSSYNKILYDLISFIKKNWSKIQEELDVSIRERRSLDYATLESMFTKLYGPHSGPVQADVFARFMGQEISYGSLSKQLQDINAEALIDNFSRYLIENLMKMKNLNLDSARATQLGVDYSFPTIQGTPLKMTMEAMVVAGIQLKTNLNGASSEETNAGEKIKILPMLSVKAHSFIGYDAYVSKSGIKMNATVSSSNGLAIKVNGGREMEIEVDIPNKMEIIQVRSEAFLMKGKKDMPDTKILPPSMQDPRIRKQSCFTGLESVFGLKMCYDLDVPDVFRANSIPLGAPILARVSINKTESSIKGYKIAVTTRTENQDKKYGCKVSVVGSASLKEANVEVLQKKESDSYLAAIKLQSAGYSGDAKVLLINKPEYKSVQTDVALKTESSDFTKAIKVDIKISSEGDAKKYETNIFVSPSGQMSDESKIFTAELINTFRAPWVMVDISAKTENVLMQYIPLRLEVGGDLKQYAMIALPTKLRKLELETDISGWKVAAFFRKTEESGQNGKYSSAFKVDRQGRDLIDLQSDILIRGRPAVDFEAHIAAKAKFGEAEYKFLQMVEYQETKIGATLQLTRPLDNVKLLEIVAQSDSEEIKFLFKVDIPEFILPIKMAARAMRQDEGYMVDAAVLRGGQTIVKLQGPVTFIKTPELTKLATNIKINDIYQWVSVHEFQKGKDSCFMELKKQQEVLGSFMLNTKFLVSQTPSLQARVYLHRLCDAKTDVSISESVVHASTDLLLLPRSSSPRRIKAFTDVNFDSKKGQMMVLWNADHDSSQKIAVDATIMPESGSQTRSNIDVKVTVMDKTYNVNAKVEAPFLVRQYRERSSIEMNVDTPAGKNWMLQMGIKSRGDYSAFADFTFKSANSNNYQLTYEFSVQRLAGYYGFQAESDMRYISPENRHARFYVQAKHESNHQRRTIQLTTEVSTPGMERPMKMVYSTENQDCSYSTKWVSELNGQETVFSWQLETFPMGGVKTWDIAFDMKAFRDVLRAVSTMVGVRSGTLLPTSAYDDQRSTYRSQYSRAIPHTHSFRIASPSRDVEAEATLSPSMAGIKVYPNRAAGEHKYEVAGEYRENQWSGMSTFEGRMSHPRLDKDLTAVVEYAASGDRRQGSFELDIFPDTADKITGSLSSVLSANNTVLIEANLSSRVLQVKPKVLVEASWAAHTAAFNFSFSKTPTSKESLEVRSKYDQISKHYSAVTFLLATEGRPVVDVSGVVEPRQGPSCDGFALRSNWHTSILGNFIVNSTVCKPAFLEVAITKASDQNIYKAKVGLQSPYKAQISLSETDRYNIWEEYMSIVGIKLKTPRHIKIDFEYKPEQTRAMKDFLMSEVDRVSEAFLTWTDHLYEEVKRQAAQKGVDFPAVEIRKLAEEIKQDIMKIYADVLDSDLGPIMEDVMEILRGPTATFVREAFYQTLADMEHVQREWASSAFQQILAFKNYFRYTINEIYQAADQISRWINTGEESEIVRRMLEELQRTVWYQLIKTDVIDPLREKYPQAYQASMEVAAKVTDSLRKDLRMLKQKLWASPTVRSFSLKIVNLSKEETLKWTLEWLLSQVTQRILIIAPEPGTYRVGIQIPLYRPVYSLSQVLNMTMQSPPSFTQKLLLASDLLSPIPSNKILETYYAWMPANLSNSVPPFNRSAYVVADTELLTFDGALLRAPRSRCKVLLSSVPGVASVHMSHPQPSAAPEITFQAGQTKAIIKPNMEVNINGRPVQGEQTVGDMHFRVTSRYITLASPLMGVHLMKEERVLMVNVSGWAFNHTKGLLGSYDNELSNDRLKSDGRNATNLHELVASWQDDPSCNTPSISPIDPAQVPVKDSVLCDLMFYLMRPCRPMVSPKPFMQRCQAEGRPIEAARSYQSSCLMQGVHFPVSLF